MSHLTPAAIKKRDVERRKRRAKAKLRAGDNYSRLGIMKGGKKAQKNLPHTVGKSGMTLSGTKRKVTKKKAPAQTDRAYYADRLKEL